MRHILENEFLHVEIESFGAELKSVKDKNTNQEYMWQADPTYWSRTSPVLFPFVGKVRNDTYTYKGKKYTMKQHGFARDMEHKLVSKTNTSLYFELQDTEETRQNYPFSFRLNIGYKLVEHEVLVLWEVTNTSTEEVLHFSIGAHPAFNCPIHGEDSKEGYQLFFNKVDEIRHHGNHPVNGLSIDEDLVLPLENHRATITPDFFDRCTYIIEGNQTQQVGIEDPEGNRYVTMFFEMPLFALWSPEGKNAPFLCIEPWCGRCDHIDFDGELEERAFNNTLQPGKQFVTSYGMHFGALN